MRWEQDCCSCGEITFSSISSWSLLRLYIQNFQLVKTPWICMYWFCLIAENRRVRPIWRFLDRVGGLVFGFFCGETTGRDLGFGTEFLSALSSCTLCSRFPKLLLWMSLFDLSSVVKNSSCSVRVSIWSLRSLFSFSNLAVLTSLAVCVKFRCFIEDATSLKLSLSLIIC